jgi:hypothetical protein
MGCATGGAPPFAALNVAICMTHGAPLNCGAVAANDPAAVEISSSAMSPSGWVTIREVNPAPAPAKMSAVVPAPKISSPPAVVVADPLDGAVPVPAPPATTSRGFVVLTPEYSSARTSAYVAGPSKATVTELDAPATMPGA